jgi:ribosomal-protein-alanine N-acetyltransferase
MATVRAMTEADLDRVMDLEQAIFSSPWRRSFFVADVARPGGLCVVAEEGGEVVGYAVAWGSEEVHLANLAVEPAVRGKGVGDALIRAVLDYGRRRSAESVYLEVRQSNSVARRFYARHGFVPTYLRKGYYENGEDAIIMELALGDEDDGQPRQV